MVKGDKMLDEIPKSTLKARWADKNNTNTDNINCTFLLDKTVLTLKTKLKTSHPQKIFQFAVKNKASVKVTNEFLNRGTIPANPGFM